MHSLCLFSALQCYSNQCQTTYRGSVREVSAPLRSMRSQVQNWATGSNVCTRISFAEASIDSAHKWNHNGRLWLKKQMAMGVVLATSQPCCAVGFLYNPIHSSVCWLDGNGTMFYAFLSVHLPYLSSSLPMDLEWLIKHRRWSNVGLPIVVKVNGDHTMWGSAIPVVELSIRSYKIKHNMLILYTASRAYAIVWLFPPLRSVIIVS